MVSSLQWATSLTITPEDIDYLINYLLERELPMSSRELALALIEHKLAREATALEDRYQDIKVYNPSQHYEVGQKVIFPALEYAAAVVEEVRPGDNPLYGDFKVIAVSFEGDASRREFATALASSHKLSADNDTMLPLPGKNEFNAEEVLDANDEDIISELEQQLVESRNLAYVGKKWFPADLLLDVNEGHLHLADAVLDMAGSIPQTTDDILDALGGLGDAPRPLQVFSMNYALKDDERFDEVGPAGQVLWYLTRQEPEAVRQTPLPLRYTPIEYDRGMLSAEMVALETEIADELSTQLKPTTTRLTEANFVLTYPHRRAGTIPLNTQTRQIFPTARRAPRIYVTLVDGQDQEEYVGWIVHRENYVFGLEAFYQKHHVPIGGFVVVRPGSDPGKIVVDIPAHRPRSEYIRLIVPKNDQINFEDHKRYIGSDFDDLMIIGVDDLQGLDTLIHQANQQRKTLVSILKMLLPALGKLTPQGTVHVRTLYSAVNVLRRCPPGPIMATLNANPDFENVGGHYWRLSTT
ncbi:MAG: hypothetical protein H7X77_10575 [Anaerolineae bacterium]|nr:hypothetical protein [Anaerolineae bacterium]